LVLPEKYAEPIPIKEIWPFLKRRKGKIDAVQFTGGEPTLQKDLIENMYKVKEMGFLVKLDTMALIQKLLKNVLKRLLLIILLWI